MQRADGAALFSATAAARLWSNGLATEPRAQASRTRHDGASHPSPFSAAFLPCLTRNSTSRMGFLVCTFCRKLSMSTGIFSSGRDRRPPGTTTRSFATNSSTVPLDVVPAAARWLGTKRGSISRLGLYRLAKIGHVKTVSAVVLWGGICR
jgi:hypothetical protein